MVVTFEVVICRYVDLNELLRRMASDPDIILSRQLFCLTPIFRGN
jgi:hypothetical protein